MRLLLIFWLLSLIYCCSNSNKPRLPYIDNELSSDKESDINAYMQYEWELTHDPALGKIPSGRLISAKGSLDKRIQFGAEIRKEDSWTSVGPADIGGRTRSILIDAQDDSGNTVYAGSVSGGLYKTTKFLSDSPDWQQVFGMGANLAISSILQDPNNPEIIYVGTGEGWFSSDASVGEGIYKSNDGGKTWQHLESSRTRTFWFVNDLIIDFNGNLYASTRINGIQKSLNGGISWREVLSINVGNSNSSRGADLEIGPDGDLYATTGLFSLGTAHKADFKLNGSKTGDIETWEDISPGEDFRRMEIAVSNTDEERVYILCEDDSDRTVSGMFRSEDGGSSWIPITIPFLSVTNDSTVFTTSQAWYNLIAQVDPNDEEVLYVGGVDLAKSEDGGDTWINISNYFISPNNGFPEDKVVHADQHNIQFVFGNSSKAIFTNDGGIYFANNLQSNSPSFELKNQNYNTTQFYSCCLWPTANDNFYLGGTQDNGTWLVEGNNLDPALVTKFLGGDGGYCFIGQDDSDVLGVSRQYIDIAVTIDNGDNYSFFQIGNSRGAFINPYTIDDKNKIVYGAFEDNKYFIITDPSNQTDIDSVLVPEFEGSQISAITVDPVVENRIWVGVRPYFDEEWAGHAGVFRIDNANTKNPTVTAFSDPSWTQFMAPRNIFIDSNDPTYMLLTFSNFGVQNVWITKNSGEQWTSVDGDLPDMPIRWGVINPSNENEIIIATDLGVFHSALLSEENTKWLEYQSGMPRLRVNMLAMRESDNRLLAASYGQGMFFTTASANQESQLAVSFDVQEFMVFENEGEMVGVNECNEPIRSISIPIRLNRSTNENVILSLNVKNSETDVAGIILPQPFEIPKEVTEFLTTIQIIDDGLREDRQVIDLILNIDQGDALIDIGEMQFRVTDDDNNFINLAVETNLASVSKTLQQDKFLHFSTDRAIARIKPISGVAAGNSCATVDIDGMDIDALQPDWLNGFELIGKTFFISSDLQDGIYEVELYLDPSELGNLLPDFLNLKILRSDKPVSEVTKIEEVEIIADAIPQVLRDDFYRIKFSTSSLGGFAITNAPDLSTVSRDEIEIVGIEIYPNPTTSEINIIGFDDVNDSYYKIYDLFGRLIEKGSQSNYINSANWPVGQYFIETGKISNGNRNVYKITKI